MARLFVESWITILPWPLLAGLMRTLQLKHWQVRSMVNLSVGTNRQTLKLIQNEQTASGTRTAIRNTCVSSSGLFPWNAATRAIRLWPSDPLLNRKQNFRWQWAVWVYDQDLGDCFPRTWNRPSEWISTSFVQLHTAKFLECNPLGLLCSLSVIFLSPSKSCSFSMRTGLCKTLFSRGENFMASQRQQIPHGRKPCVLWSHHECVPPKHCHFPALTLKQQLSEIWGPGLFLGWSVTKKWSWPMSLEKNLYGWKENDFSYPVSIFQRPDVCNRWFIFKKECKKGN